MAVYDYAEQFMRQLAQMWTREMVSYDLTQSNQGIKFLNRSEERRVGKEC